VKKIEKKGSSVEEELEFQEWFGPDRDQFFKSLEENQAAFDEHLDKLRRSMSPSGRTLAIVINV